MAHIDGTAPNEREAHESAEDEEPDVPSNGGLASNDEENDDMISEREEGEECSDTGTEKANPDDFAPAGDNE